MKYTCREEGKILVQSFLPSNFNDTSGVLESTISVKFSFNISKWTTVRDNPFLIRAWLYYSFQK